MLPPIGLQGFPFNETMGQIYGSSPVRPDPYVLKFAVAAGLMPVMAYIAFVWYFSAKFLLTRRDAAFEALVWWTQKKTGRTDCRGRSFVQLWLAHAVRVSFRSSPEGEICCEVVVVGWTPSQILGDFLEKVARACPSVSIHHLVEGPDGLCRWARSRATRPALALGVLLGADVQKRLTAELNSFLRDEDVFVRMGLPHSRVYLLTGDSSMDAVALSLSETLSYTLYRLEVDVRQEGLPHPAELQRACCDLGGRPLVHLKMAAVGREAQPAQPSEGWGEEVGLLVQRLRAVHGAIVLITCPQGIPELGRLADLALQIAPVSAGAVLHLAHVAMGPQATADQTRVAQALHRRSEAGDVTFLEILRLLERHRGQPHGLLPQGSGPEEKEEGEEGEDVSF